MALVWTNHVCGSCLQGRPLARGRTWFHWALGCSLILCRGDFFTLMVSRGVVVVFPESNCPGKKLRNWSGVRHITQRGKPERIVDPCFSNSEWSKSCHHAGFSYKNHRKYSGAGGSADIPSGDNARRRWGGRESHPGPHGPRGRCAGCCQQPCSGMYSYLPHG